MSIYRQQTEGVGIECIKAACPVCKNDVKGNDTYLFYCKKCNLLYKREALRASPEQAAAIMKEKVAQKYMQDKESISLGDQQPIAMKRNTRLPKQTTYLASKSSSIVHASNCPYAKNIKKSNRIIFKDIDDAKGYKRCSCIEVT